MPPTHPASTCRDEVHGSSSTLAGTLASDTPTRRRPRFKPSIVNGCESDGDREDDDEEDGEDEEEDGEDEDDGDDGDDGEGEARTKFCVVQALYKINGENPTKTLPITPVNILFEIFFPSITPSGVVSMPGNPKQNAVKTMSSSKKGGVSSSGV